MEKNEERRREQDRFARITEWFNQAYQQTFFTGSNGLPIRYCCHMKDDSAATVLISTGRTEFIEKYQEICWELRNEPFSLCVYDHVGQGQSGRLLSDPEKGHVDSFDRYVTDLETLISRKIPVMGRKPLVLLGYSMGGAVSVLLAAARPDLVDGLILCAPMLQINSGRLLSPFVAEKISNLFCWLGFAENYIWGGGPFKARMSYKNNVLTSDKKRFIHNMGLMADLEKVALGSPTFGWMKQAYQAMAVARRKGGMIQCPLLVLKGGRDKIVRLDEIDAFCRTAPDCRQKYFPESRHELMMERDEIRDEVIAEIKDFTLRCSRG